MKEDLFSEEEILTVLKGLKTNKAPGADSVINEFLKYGVLILFFKKFWEE